MATAPEETPIVEHGVSAPYDGSNRLLSETPAEMTVGIVQTQGGQRLALTFRTPSTTFTVFPDRAIADTWRGMIAAAVSSMNGLILPPGVNG